MDTTTLRIASPLGINARNNKFHVFGQDGRSLCGRWAMFKLDDETSEQFKGTETFNDKGDCKSCFKKAGIEIPKK